MAKKKTQNENHPHAEENSQKINHRSSLPFQLALKLHPNLSEKQKAVVDLVNHKTTRVVFIKGPAGTSKTYLAMLAALTLLNDHAVSDLIFMRAAVESADSKLGYMPGDLNEKFSYYLTPFTDKLHEIISAQELKLLQEDGRIQYLPVNFARGLHLARRAIILDEAQNNTVKELQTIMTRLGNYSRLIICGDTDQSDLPPAKSGFNKVFEMFKDDAAAHAEGIVAVELTEEDIVRSKLCRFIVGKFKAAGC